MTSEKVGTSVRGTAEILGEQKFEGARWQVATDAEIVAQLCKLRSHGRASYKLAPRRTASGNCGTATIY